MIAKPISPFSLPPSPPLSPPPSLHLSLFPLSPDGEGREGEREYIGKEYTGCSLHDYFNFSVGIKILQLKAEGDREWVVGPGGSFQLRAQTFDRQAAPGPLLTYHPPSSSFLLSAAI